MGNFSTIPVGDRRLGDDAGYRTHPISLDDERDPEQMVAVERVRCHPVYHFGATPKLTSYYEGGLGGSSTILVRNSLHTLLVNANIMLDEYGLELVVLDGWRPWWIQVNLWRYLRDVVIFNYGLAGKTLSLDEELLVGIHADDIGSYCALQNNKNFKTAKKQMVGGSFRTELAYAARKLGMTTGRAAELFLIFQANLGRNKLKIDPFATTAHGSGGAVDVYLLDKRSLEFTSLGVPFDYIAPYGTAVSPAVMDYFEISNPNAYADLVAMDPVLQWYLKELGYGSNIDQAFTDARHYRRILYHTMSTCGASFYAEEPWHWQINNACDAVIKRQTVALWGNKGAYTSVQAQYPHLIPHEYQ